MTTLELLCREWLTSLPAWAECGRAGGGLTTTLVTRRLLCPDLARRWTAMPAWSATLTEQQRDQAQALLRWGTKRVERQLRLMRAGIDAGIEAAVDRAVEVTVTQLAEKLIRVVASFEAEGEELSEAEIAAVISTYLSNRPPRGRRLTRAEFADYEPGFRHRWARIGAANLAEHPYSALALGEDERPPFIRTGRENTWHGLGRSIFSRFQIASGDADVEGGAHDVACAEIERACERLGLGHESCLIALRSLSAGFLLGPADDGAWEVPQDVTIDETWKRETTPLAAAEPSSDDPRRPRGRSLHGEMASYAQACVATFVMREAQGRYLRRRGFMNAAHEHAMRRAWMMCFQHDRRGQPIDGPAGARIVSIAIFKGIPTGQAYIRARRPLTVEREPAGSPDGDMISGGATTDQARLEASLAWLAEDRARAHAVLTRQPDAVAAYERRVASGDFLPLDTLLDHYAKDSE